MRFARILSCAVGTVALCVLGAPAFADEATPIHLVEVYDVTPGVSATHEVTLSTTQPLLGEQCQSMGTGARASSTVSVDVDGVAGCRFTWVLEEAGAEIVTVDDGGVFHFHSVSASLLEGFSSPEAVATIESVTLVAHASEIVEASHGGVISSAGASTRTDASTVTWTNVRDDVSAVGTVSPDAADLAASPSPSPTAPVSTTASSQRGGGSSRSSLAMIAGITGAVLALALVGALVRWSARSRRAAADAQFEHDAAMRAAQRQLAMGADEASAPYAALTPISDRPAPEPPPAAAPPAPQAVSPSDVPPAPDHSPVDAPQAPRVDQRFAPPPPAP